MSITDAAVPARAPVVDAAFARRFVTVCGLVPALLLAWDAAHHELGVDEVNFAIRTTGLLGLVLLSMSLVITPLRRLTGWTLLIAVRRNLGVLGFGYIAAHFGIFAVWDQGLDLGSVLHEILTRQYLWFGTASLVLMIPLAVTSTDVMVARLGGVRWKRLHRIAYLAVLAGVIHYVLLVKADVTKPLVFGAVFGGLMLVRGVQHYLDLRAEVRTAHARVVAARAGASKPRAFWSGTVRVARIFDETHDVKTFRFVPLAGGPLPFQHTAGQYVTLRLGIDGVRVTRSYTIASSPLRAGAFEITVKRAADGYASQFLHDRVREGDTLDVSAPAGRFVFAGDEAERVVLIAGGVGITPMMSVIRGLTDRCWAGSIYLVYAVRSRADVIFGDELATLARRFPNLHVCITLSGDEAPGWDGPRGRVSRALVEEFVPGLTRGPVLVCGPAPMMAAVRRLLVDELGVPDADVHEEAFVSPVASSARAAPADAGVPVDAVVQFQRAGRRIDLPAGLTVLDGAADAGITLPSECRSGICGQCKTRLISGRVVMDVQDALTPADRARGLVLACQARPTCDVVLDA